ncbi:MAG: ABC transporter permease subunit [Anaerolineae bacterium]|nr:ABC transporter permease subunit [Anaerolineae bacterium]
MNIFVRELRANLKSLIIWAVIVILFVMVGVSKFSAYYNNPEMLAILDAIPPAMVAAFSFGALNLTTVSGFFGLMFTYFALLLGIAAAMWGSDIISKEERDKTVEFSLTLPVTRSRVVTAKALAALVNCLALLFITWGISLISAQPYEPDGEFYRFLALLMLAIFILQLIFLAVGIFLGCAMKRYKRAASMAVSLLLGTYFLSVISALNENLDFLKYFSPFKYFDVGILLRESRFDLTFIGLSLAIVVVSMAGAYWAYARRDLYI